MLDYTMYPHILDLVIDCATPDALRALRASSRAMRLRADAILFPHVEVVVPELRGTNSGTSVRVFVNPLGSWLLLEWLGLHGVEKTRIVDNTPQIEDDAKVKARKLQRAHVCQVVGRARVIDRRDGLVSSFPYGHFYLRAMMALEAQTRPTVLVRDIGVSEFHDGNPFIITVRQASNTRPTLISLTLDCPLWEEPEWQLSHCLDCMPLDEDELVPASDVTIHLLASRHTQHDVEGGLKIFELLYLFLYCCRCPRRGTTLTVVGGQKTCRIGVGASPDASQDEFHSAIDAAMQDLAWKLDFWTSRFDLSVDEIRETWRSYFHFLSPAEYAATVGAEQVALETRVDPRNDPPAAYLA